MKVQMFDFNTPIKEKSVRKEIVISKLRNKFKNPQNIELNIHEEDNRLLGITFIQRKSIDAEKGTSINDLINSSQSIGGWDRNTILYPNINLIIIENTRYITFSDLFEEDFVYIKN